ncbi:MAG: hypothetical protein PHT13_00975 [Methanosarcina sp.]|nr:hypothetical protein [Methanosarcina sp.]
MPTISGLNTSTTPFDTVESVVSFLKNADDMAMVSRFNQLLSNLVSLEYEEHNSYMPLIITSAHDLYIAPDDLKENVSSEFVQFYCDKCDEFCGVNAEDVIAHLLYSHKSELITVLLPSA